MISRELGQRDEIDRIYLVTEYHPSRLRRIRSKLTILSILPRRDSLPSRGPLYNSASFIVTHLILVALLVWVGLFKRRDILHFHSRLVYPWTALLVRLLRLRAVADVRDNFFKPASISAFPAVVYVSQHIGECLAQSVAPHRRTYFPVPIDTQRIFALAHRKCLRESAAPYFLFVGVINELKGIPELIAGYQAYRAARGERSLELGLVGRNHLKRSIDFGAFPGVRVYGELPAEATYSLMAGAERVVLPSKSEGMPRVCLEAMVLRVPVICPPGIAEFDAHCPRNVLREVTPEAIREMMERPRETLVVNGYPISRHEWKSAVEKLCAVYRQLSEGTHVH